MLQHSAGGFRHFQNFHTKHKWCQLGFLVTFSKLLRLIRLRMQEALPDPPQLGAVAPLERWHWNTISKLQHLQLLQYCSFNVGYRQQKRLLLLKDLTQTAFLHLKPGLCWSYPWGWAPQAVIALNRNNEGVSVAGTSQWQKAIIPNPPANAIAPVGCHIKFFWGLQERQNQSRLKGRWRGCERRPCHSLDVKSETP